MRVDHVGVDILGIDLVAGMHDLVAKKCNFEESLGCVRK